MTFRVFWTWTMPTRLPMEIVDRDMARVLAEKTEAERLQKVGQAPRCLTYFATSLLFAQTNRSAPPLRFGGLTSGGRTARLDAELG